MKKLDGNRLKGSTVIIVYFVMTRIRMETLFYTWW